MEKAKLAHGGPLPAARPFLFMGYGFQTMGLLYTTTSNTGFITGLSVVLVPFLSLALLKHAISRYTWFSAILAVAGLYLLTFTGSAFSLNKGDGLILLCAVAFALQVAYTGVYAPRYPALPLATLQLAFCRTVQHCGFAPCGRNRTAGSQRSADPETGCAVGAADIHWPDERVCLLDSDRLPKVHHPVTGSHHLRYGAGIRRLDRPCLRR